MTSGNLVSIDRNIKFLQFVSPTIVEAFLKSILFYISNSRSSKAVVAGFRLASLGSVAVEKSETLSKAPFLYRGLTVIVTDI